MELFTQNTKKPTYKTIMKLDWIKRNIDAFQNKKELRLALTKEFNINPKQAYKILEVYSKKRMNLTELKKRHIIKSSLLEKKHIGSTQECYFCLKKAELIHHIGYLPERTISICAICHQKVHFVMEVYHLNEKARSEISADLINRFERIKEIIDKKILIKGGE